MAPLPPFNISPELLTQLAGTQTDPYTIMASYQLCHDFKISIQGQRSLNAALSNLPLYQTPDENLHFGWGRESPLRNKGIHDGAYEHVATIMALCESFHESYAARVMHALAQQRAEELGMALTPHYSQWKRMVHLSNGCLAATDFGLLVEDFIRMDPFNIVWDLSNGLREFPIQPQVVADALIHLARLSNGEFKQLSIFGSPIISWVAAFAVWFYDLRITIFSIDGTKLHVSDPHQETQALFIFREEPGISISAGSWLKDVARVSEHRSSISDARSSVPRYQISIHNTPFSGRVGWQSLLPRVFGQSFHHLDHEESKHFATIIGSAAKLFEGLATGEAKDKHPNLLTTQTRENSSSYGPGLIETLTNWLPELRRFQGRMERALRASHNDASEAYVSSLTHLQKVCNCEICTMNPATAQTIPEDEAISTSNDNESAIIDPTKLSPSQSRYCLTTLTETIISLGLILSRLVVSSNVYPSRAGIQAFYQSQVHKRQKASQTTTTANTMTPATFTSSIYSSTIGRFTSSDSTPNNPSNSTTNRSTSMSSTEANENENWAEQFRIIYGNEWNAPDTRRLSNSIQIFSGSRPRTDMPDNLVAVSHEGICAYFVDLEKSRPKSLLEPMMGGLSLSGNTGSSSGGAGAKGAASTAGAGTAGKVGVAGGGRGRSVSSGEGPVKLIRITSGGINVGPKVFSRAALGRVSSSHWNPEDPWEEVKVEHLADVSLWCK